MRRRGPLRRTPARVDRDPHRAACEAYFWMQIAQAEWIRRAYRRTVAPALRSRRLDASMVSAKTMPTYMMGAVLPRIMDAARRRSRPSVLPPNPWVDFP